MSSSIQGILLAIVAFLYSQDYSKAEEMAYEVNNVTTGCNGTEDAECTVCIGRYRQLQTYILDNQDLLDQLTETFYGTGEDTAQFVRITYDFQIYKTNSTTNGSNGSNITSSSSPTNSSYDVMMEGDSFNCTNQQELYIWSSSPYFLLGPKALYWFTLFAVNVRESSVTIQLPCLCEEMHDRLLSRLTYLVR